MESADFFDRVQLPGPGKKFKVVSRSHDGETSFEKVAPPPFIRRAIIPTPEHFPLHCFGLLCRLLFDYEILYSAPDPSLVGAFA